MGTDPKAPQKPRQTWKREWSNDLDSITENYHQNILEFTTEYQDNHPFEGSYLSLYYSLAITIDAFLGGHCEDSTISHTYVQPRNSSGNCPAPHNVCAACRGPTKMRKKHQIRNLKNLGNRQGGKYIDGKNRQTKSGPESRLNLFYFYQIWGCFYPPSERWNPLTLM